ncbi:hypothetical protein QKW35_10055 [Pontibacterium granulatum]|uniref:hypothetical protein n=1 Tax=Pontibacterium granulatum TaxID=2036029 RepID=UPI00249AB26F|nr:hypothetical protein [Pontibacterium granulatum]MDI3324719.1 hypothetical protein [Pontibacterium granulatum]
MKTIAKLFAAAFVSVVMLTSQVFAAGSLYPLDGWDHSQEGHMSADFDETMDDMDKGQ